MAIPTLSGSYIDETYGRLVQVSGNEFADGLGNPITFGTTPTSSLLTTASAAGNTITFTKGDGSTFPVTVSGGAGAAFPYTGSAIITGSLVVTGSITSTLGFTGSLYGTASQAITSSYPFATSGSTIYSVNPKAGPIFLPTYNCFVVGANAGQNSPNSQNSIILGVAAGQNTYANYSNFIGFNSGLNVGNNINISQNYSNYIGAYAGYNAFSSQGVNFIGYNSGYNAAYADSSSFIGINAGYSAISSSNSNFIGTNAGYQAKNTTYSNFIGHQSGYNASGSINSNFIGKNAGDSATASADVIGIGTQAGYNAQRSSGSIYIGTLAGTGNINGYYNVYIGNEAGFNHTANQSNVFIGYRAGFRITGDTALGNSNIIIGNSVTLPPSTNSSLNIGGVIFGSGLWSPALGNNPYSGSANGNIGINIPSPSYNLHASGTIAFPSLTQSSSAYIVTIDTASGQLYYTASSAFGSGGGPVNTSGFVTTSSFNAFTSSVVTTSSFNTFTSSYNTGSFSGSFTGNLIGTASWATNFVSASNYVLNSATSSFIRNTQTASFATTGSNTFRGNQIITGSITQNASTASFGGLVGIGTTTPTYTLDISGSLEVVSKRYTIGQQIGQYQKVAYQMGPGDPTYTSQYQQYITTLSGSIGQWKFSNNLTGYLSTTNAIGYAENNHNTIYNWNVSFGTLANTFVYARNTEIVGIPGLNWQEWFTPTKDELVRLWGNKNSLGITNPTSGFFWSSTDINASTAWVIDWESGNMVAKTKTTAYDILPIRYVTILHAPSSLQFDNDGLRLYDIGAGSTGYNLQYDTTTGQIKYTGNPNIPTLPVNATVDQINIPDGADVYVRPGELEQSKYATINIFNNINFT